MSLLSVDKLDKCFISTKKGRQVHAVNQVSFSMEKGDFLGLVGESGCGKSTIAKLLSGLMPKDSGCIRLNEKELRYPYPREIYHSLQMVFQLPRDSFDPRRKIGYCLKQMLANFSAEQKGSEQQVIELLHRVGLGPEFYNKYPHEMSGGECQRAAIARAIAAEPDLIICDEITSALDVSIQAQIVELLQELRKETNIAVLFISHDLALVQNLCDKIMVMKDGEIVERGSADQIMNHPQHEYTQLLLSSVMSIE